MNFEMNMNFMMLVRWVSTFDVIANVKWDLRFV